MHTKFKSSTRSLHPFSTLTIVCRMKIFFKWIENSYTFVFAFSRPKMPLNGTLTLWSFFRISHDLNQPIHISIIALEKQVYHESEKYIGIDESLYCKNTFHCHVFGETKILYYSLNWSFLVKFYNDKVSVWVYMESQKLEPINVPTHDFLANFCKTTREKFV